MSQSNRPIRSIFIIIIFKMQQSALCTHRLATCDLRPPPKNQIVDQLRSVTLAHFLKTMNQTARNLIRSRPISVLATTGVSGLCTYGYLVEWQTCHLDRKQELGGNSGTTAIGVFS